jgi:hypothetical protein
MNVTQTPLTSLRTEAGVDLHRVRDVVSSNVKTLLSSAVVRFVIAEVGKPLRWIPAEERFRFWKSDVQPHIADEEKKSLDVSPGGYIYFASEWRSDDCIEAFVLLEKHH